MDRESLFLRKQHESLVRSGSVAFVFYSRGPAWIAHRLLKQFSLNFASAASDTAIGFFAQSGSALVLELFFGLFTLLFLLITYIYYSQPTHVRLASDGISLERRRKKRKILGEIKWKDLGKVDLFWPAGKTLPQDCLIKFHDKASPSESKLTLKLGSIVNGSERNELRKAIELNALEARKDARLLEFLAPVQDHSYTELWLAALSAPPKRERLTPLSEGSTLQSNRYRVICQLGVGGQGTAYLATDELKNSEEVVLKEFILPVYVDTNVLRQSLERMQNEAAMLEKLDNDRIVRLRNFFVEDHRGYLVLEKIDGETLEQIVSAEGPMNEQRARGLALQMCEILEYLHSLTPPVIHRDFTPDNLILGGDGKLKLVDFNVAQQTESTATGTVVGKHSYLPPEQFRGRPTTQSDIYAMGATLAYLVTGKAPEPIMVSHPRQINPVVSEEFDNVVAKATAFDTKKRYESIKPLREDLQKLVEGSQKRLS